MKKNWFLFGIIVVLVFFGFVFPIFPSLQFTFTVNDSLTDWIQNFLTLFVVILAIWGKTVKSWFYVPNVIIENYINNLQLQAGYYQGYTRLLLRNTSSSTEAKEVEVYVFEITDRKSVRNNFLPVPLVWTHNGKFIRNISPNQPAYLDFCVIPNVEDEYGAAGQKATAILVLIAGHGVPDYQNIYPGKTKLKIMINLKNGKQKIYNIYLNYKLGDENIKITKIEHEG